MTRNPCVSSLTMLSATLWFPTSCSMQLPFVCKHTVGKIIDFLVSISDIHFIVKLSPWKRIWSEANVQDRVGPKVGLNAT